MQHKGFAPGVVGDVGLLGGAGVEDAAAHGIGCRVGHMGVADQPGIHGQAQQFRLGHGVILLFGIVGKALDGAVGNADVD